MADPTPDRSECYEILRGVRFEESVACLHCESGSVIRRGTSKKDAQRYHCKDCGSYFTDLTDTVFEGRQIPIEDLAYVVRKMESRSPEELAADLDAATSRVRRFVEDVRTAASEEFLDPFRGPESLDYSLLMAGDRISPFVGEERADSRSEEFSGWILALRRE